MAEPDVARFEALLTSRGRELLDRIATEAPWAGHGSADRCLAARSVSDRASHRGTSPSFGADLMGDAAILVARSARGRRPPY